LQVYLYQRQIDVLRALAKRQKVSMAELIRRSVDRYLAELPLEEDPLWDIVGMFDSGIGDLSEKHDEYIVRWIKEDRG
jgi:hypothetical protein